MQCSLGTKNNLTEVRMIKLESATSYIFVICDTSNVDNTTDPA